MSLITGVIIGWVLANTDREATRQQGQKSSVTPDYYQRTNEFWKKASYSKSRESKAVGPEEYHRIITSPYFLANHTKYGQNSQYGRLAGMLHGVRIYLKKD